MPTVLSHAVAATAIGAALITPPRLPVWGLGALCAVLPDLDVIAFALGLPYGHVLVVDGGTTLTAPQRDPGGAGG